MSWHCKNSMKTDKYCQKATKSKDIFINYRYNDKSLIEYMAVLFNSSLDQTKMKILK